MGLDRDQRDALAALAGPRFNARSSTLRIVSDLVAPTVLREEATREDNKRECVEQLIRLVEEVKKPEQLK